MNAPVQTQEYRGDTLQDRLFVKVFTVARVTIDRNWNARDVCSGYWRIYINSRPGAAVELADGTLYRLRPGHPHLIPAWVRFHCRNTCAIEHRYAHFDVIGLTAETVQRLFPRPLMVNLDEAEARLARTLDGSGSPEVAICRAKAVIYTALAAAFRDLPDGAAGLLDDPGPMAPALRQIETQLGAPLNNRALAALCHMSEDHFGRVFRARLGRTPAQYILERRIAAASQELAFTRDSIEQIAERLGFANRFHLTRMFTRRMGAAPAAFRRQLRV